MNAAVRFFGILCGLGILLAGIASCREDRAGSVEIPDLVVFAGDTIPVWEPDVRERLERELRINQYWQANTLQWLRRSRRWFPLIDSLLASHKIPADFRYLVAIESGFENVSSSKGATGFWQLMEPTALEFGLIVNSEIDERLDPGKSGVAACRLLQRGFAEFKSWPAAAVSYNIGVHGLKSVFQAQYTDSFYDVLINQESSRYFFRILAAKLILENPEKYGFEQPEAMSDYQWKKQIIADSIPDLAWWCRKNGFSYKCFRLLNPWVKSARLHIPAGLTQLMVKIPLDCRQFTSMELSSLPADSAVAFSNLVEEKLVSHKDMGGFQATDVQKAKQAKFYTVRKGENLSMLAIRFQVSVTTLYQLNPELRKKTGLQEGFRLRLAPD